MNIYVEVYYNATVKLAKNHKRKNILQVKVVEMDIKTLHRSEKFPVAFKVTKLSPEHTDKNKYVTEEIRTFNSKLYTRMKRNIWSGPPLTFNEFCDFAPNLEDFANKKKTLIDEKCIIEFEKQFSKEHGYDREKYPGALVLENKFGQTYSDLLKLYGQYIVYKGYVWQETSTPYYHVDTFLSSRYVQGEINGENILSILTRNDAYIDVSAIGYFDAFSKKEAIDEAKRVIMDSNMEQVKKEQCINSLMKSKADIKVLMPEFVDLRKSYKKVTITETNVYEAMIEVPYGLNIQKDVLCEHYLDHASLWKKLKKTKRTINKIENNT